MTAIPISSRQMTLEKYPEFDDSAEGRYTTKDFGLKANLARAKLSSSNLSIADWRLMRLFRE